MKYPVSVEVDGREYSREVEARMLLSELLREELGPSAVRVGCDRSACGCCTVLVDGLAVRSCSLLAVQVDGRSVTTLDGLARRREDPSRVESTTETVAEVRPAGCGYCSPGIAVAAEELRALGRSPSRSEVRWALEGTGCRCAGHRRLQEAVELSLDRSRRLDQNAKGAS